VSGWGQDRLDQGDYDARIIRANLEAMGAVVEPHGSELDRSHMLIANERTPERWIADYVVRHGKWKYRVDAKGGSVSRTSGRYAIELRSILASRQYLDPLAYRYMTVDGYAFSPDAIVESIRDGRCICKGEPSRADRTCGELFLDVWDRGPSDLYPWDGDLPDYCVHIRSGPTSSGTPFGMIPQSACKRIPGWPGITELCDGGVTKTLASVSKTHSEGTTNAPRG
jgi:hypothetical protein